MHELSALIADELSLEVDPRVSKVAAAIARQHGRASRAVTNIVVAAIARAAPTLLWAAGQRPGEEPLDWWRRAFALTYSAELRAERQERAASVVDFDPNRYERFTSPAIAEATRIDA